MTFVCSLIKLADRLNNIARWEFVAQLRAAAPQCAEERRSTFMNAVAGRMGMR